MRDPGLQALVPMAFAVALCASACSASRLPQSESHVPATADPPGSVEAEQRNLPVTTQDLAILDQAEELLSSPAKWDRHDDRICSPEDTTLSLFCALQRASVEVLGAYDHRRAALQEVRFAIEAAAPNQVFEHRLRDYNNLPTTRFEDIKTVLHVARRRVAERLGG